MTIRTYESYTTYKSIDGEVRTYSVKRKYTSINSYKLSDETRDIILRKSAEGVPATRIGRDIGISAERVRRVIRKANISPSSPKNDDQPIPHVSDK